MEVSFLADDFDRVLIRADRAIAPECVEQRPDRVVGLGVVGVVVREAGVGDVVVDPDGEVRPRGRRGEFGEDGGGHRRRELLRAKTVAAADDSRQPLEARGRAGGVLDERGHDVLVEWLAGGAGLFRPVEDGNGARGTRKGGDEVGHREGPEEAHLDHAHAFAARERRIDGLFGGAAAGAHDHDDALRGRVAVVVEGTVGAAGKGGELVHGGLRDPGDRVVEGVGGFTGLEEDVRVLGGAADDRSVRREPAFPVGDDELLGDHGANVVVRNEGDLVDFVRSAEAIEEVHEGDAGEQRGACGDEREVVGLLHGGGAEHGPARGARSHDIAVVAKDRERMGGNGACGDVEDDRRQLSGDLEHVRDHQEEALGSRERRRESARL